MDVPELDLVDVVAPLMRGIAVTLAAAKEMAGTGSAMADSPAMGEFTEDERLATPTMRDPIDVAHSVARVLRLAASDHLRSYAGLFASQPVPVYSHLIVARASLESTALAYWLAEPGIGAERRVQRAMLIRLDNANERRRGPLKSEKEAGREFRENLSAAALEHGWPIAKNKDLRLGNEELPSTRDLLRPVLPPPADTGDGIDRGHLVWWHLSNVAHSSMFALLQSVDLDQQQDQGPVGMGIRVPLITSSASVELYGALTSRAYLTMMARHRALFGWDSPVYDAAAMALDQLCAAAIGRRAKS